MTFDAPWVIKRLGRGGTFRVVARARLEAKGTKWPTGSANVPSLRFAPRSLRKELLYPLDRRLWLIRLGEHWSLLTEITRSARRPLHSCSQEDISAWGMCLDPV